jgi:hypothetical protein
VFVYGAMASSPFYKGGQGDLILVQSKEKSRCFIEIYFDEVHL